MNVKPSKCEYSHKFDSHPVTLVCHLLYISTSFWVLRTPKSWLKHFFRPFFSLFCSFQSFFSDFTPEIKCFDQLLGAHSTQKLVEIHNNHWSYLLMSHKDLSLVLLDVICECSKTADFCF